MVTTVVLLAVLAAGIFLFMRRPEFGRLPSGERKQRILKSPHYSNGSFKNLEVTPDLAEGVSMPKVLADFFFRKSKQSVPSKPVPSEKINLKNGTSEDILVWFGHSSYFMRIDGYTFLVDPVFSGSASPLPFSVRAFPGSDRYDADDMPEIDFLIITHDHWDHLDYKTVKKLRAKVKRVITGLGTGSHLERWGYLENSITELDWYEQTELMQGYTLTALPARHFSGRGFKRNQTLWVSFALATPKKKIYLGGDSGYGAHFSDIGEKYGPFDLAVLECGQYNQSWKYIHMMPEETVRAGFNIGAEKILPVHWCKFSLALHSWDEPIERFKKECGIKNRQYMHTIIGAKNSI